MKADNQAELCCPYLWSCSEKNLMVPAKETMYVLQTTPEGVTAKGQTSLLAQKQSIRSKISLQHGEKWQVWSIQYRSGGIWSWVTQWWNSPTNHCYIFAPLTNKYSSANFKPKSSHQESPDKKSVTFCTQKLCYSKCANVASSFL